VTRSPSYLTYIDTAIATIGARYGLPYPAGYVERYGNDVYLRKATLDTWAPPAMTTSSPSTAACEVGAAHDVRLRDLQRMRRAPAPPLITPSWSTSPPIADAPAPLPDEA